jgi:phosphatidylglycerol:prolipoprotein diacylglycerol transferase
VWWQGRHAVEPLRDRGSLIAVLVGALAGASIGARLVGALEFAPELWRRQAPLAAWFAGQSLVGGLLGAIAGVELAKRWAGIRQATGDAFLLPLAVGIAVGRLGCLAAGLEDGTHGVPTTLPWGMDLGDGVPRHPVQLYEILVVLAFGVALHRARGVARVSRATRAGDAFRTFVVGYLLFRFGVEVLKPPFGAERMAGDGAVPALYLGLTAIQIVALVGALAYAPAALRLLRALRKEAVA